jgi:L-rhamnose isomerase
VWEYYCVSKNVPHGGEWLNNVRKYEADVLSKRV